MQRHEEKLDTIQLIEKSVEKFHHYWATPLQTMIDNFLAAKPQAFLIYHERMKNIYSADDFKTIEENKLTIERKKEREKLNIREKLFLLQCSIFQSQDEADIDNTPLEEYLELDLSGDPKKAQESLNNDEINFLYCIFDLSYTDQSLSIEDANALKGLAERGHPGFQYLMGLYYKGNGNIEEAKKFFEKSAYAGIAKASIELANLYAYKIPYLCDAISQGNKGALSKLSFELVLLLEREGNNENIHTHSYLLQLKRLYELFIQYGSVTTKLKKEVKLTYAQLATLLSQDKLYDKVVNSLEKDISKAATLYRKAIESNALTDEEKKYAKDKFMELSVKYPSNEDINYHIGMLSMIWQFNIYENNGNLTLFRPFYKLAILKPEKFFANARDDQWNKIQELLDDETATNILSQLDKEAELLADITGFSMPLVRLTQSFFTDPSMMAAKNELQSKTKNNVQDQKKAVK